MPISNQLQRSIPIFLQSVLTINCFDIFFKSKNKTKDTLHDTGSVLLSFVLGQERQVSQEKKKKNTCHILVFLSL